MAVYKLYFYNPGAFSQLGGKAPLDLTGCECLWGQAVRNPDGSCGCTDPTNHGGTAIPTRYPPRHDGGHGNWWPGSNFPYGPAQVQQAIPSPTSNTVKPAEPVNPAHAEADLWFGYEPWKVVAAGAAAAGLIYYASTQPASK